MYLYCTTKRSCTDHQAAVVLYYNDKTTRPFLNPTSSKVISVSNITRFSNYCYSNTRCRLLVITLNLLNIMCSFAGIDINLNLIL